MVDAMDDGGSPRFELVVDGRAVSSAAYRLQGGAVVISHVQTAVASRGNGYADRLMAGIVEHVRERGRTIVPLCWFADAYLRARPECSDLLG